MSFEVVVSNVHVSKDRRCSCCGRSVIWTTTVSRENTSDFDICSDCLGVLKDVADAWATQGFVRWMSLGYASGSELKSFLAEPAEIGDDDVDE